MKIAVGCDHGGFVMINELLNHLKNEGYDVDYVGTFTEDSCDYPDYAVKVCEKVVKGEVKFGVLICGTGIGMSMAANKVKGIRCAHVNDEFSAEMTRKHNDANVIALGARITSTENIIKYVDIFLTNEFEGGGRHTRRVEKLMQIEK
jgi:ribose 5-phosphate isomerase B